MGKKMYMKPEVVTMELESQAILAASDFADTNLDGMSIGGYSEGGMSGNAKGNYSPWDFDEEEY